MKKLLSISYALVVASLIFTAQVGSASAQNAAKTSKSFTYSVVERRGYNGDLDGPPFESIFPFTSTEMRQISGRYAAEGSNVHSQAMHEYWDKLNARIEAQRTRVLIP